MANLNQQGVDYLVSKIYGVIRNVENAKTMVEVTYSELKELRDSNKLIPGCEYRITDYVTTTIQENTMSAGHKFDIIVTADSENTLNEIARACYHGDGIVHINSFYNANCWDAISSIFTFNGFLKKDGKLYCLYSDSIGDVLFDFDDKSKVYYGSQDDIKFYPSYYRCAEYGYNDWTPYDGISTIGGDDIIVPFISMAGLSNLDNGAEIAESIRKQYDVIELDYFRNTGANLSAWKIWYSLDNDTNRFKWANPYKRVYNTSNCKPFVNYTSDNDDTFCFDDGIVAIARVLDDSSNGEFYETLDDGLNEVFTHFGYTDDIYGVKQLTLYSIGIEDGEYGGIMDTYHYKGILTIDGEEYDAWARFVGDVSTDGAKEGYGGSSSENKIIYTLTNRIVSGEIIYEPFGKGVIYRMIDEWGNDCPYDFKNIQFRRGLYVEGGGIATKGGDEDFFAYCYTFSWEDSENVIMDASIFGNNGYLLDGEGQINGVYGNVIGVYNSYDGDESPQSTKQYLNDIVFFSTYGYDGGIYYGCYSNTFGNNCRSNTFGIGCDSNTFGNNCYSNNFGNGCFSNTFGDSCYTNTFGDSCYTNTFGNNCYSNKFGNGCQNNTFGNQCSSNKFGNQCSSNKFGNYCHSNTFGNYCHYNTFDNQCYLNTFGNSCHSNTFGNQCFSNTFGISCHSNTFGNNCRYNKFGTADNLKSYYRHIIFDNGNCKIRLNCTEKTGSGKYYQNVRIGLGVNNTTTYKDISDGNVNQSYETLYRPADSKTLNV